MFERLIAFLITAARGMGGVKVYGMAVRAGSRSFRRSVRLHRVGLVDVNGVAGLVAIVLPDQHPYLSILMNHRNNAVFGRRSASVALNRNAGVSRHCFAVSRASGQQTSRRHPSTLGEWSALSSCFLSLPVKRLKGFGLVAIAVQLDPRKPFSPSEFHQGQQLRVIELPCICVEQF